jgi:hypothetical protein
MPKTKAKKRIRVSTTVQLKNDITVVGEVVGKGDGKASWKVKWTAGRLKGTTTTQSSKSLRLWQVDLANLPVSDSSSAEEDEPEVPEIDHGKLKRKFSAHANTLVGNKVAVSTLFVLRLN